MSYQRRLVDDALDELFPDLAAIALEGAKGVGKTATASRRAKTILSLNRPEQRETLAANLDYIIQVPPPVLIDEWQLEPAVWDRVRTAVDDDNSGGRFLLAGSAGVAPGVRIHSGAGRIVSLQLPENGVAVRRPRALLAWLTAYGAATATDASYTTILDAATAGDDDEPARATVDTYREHLTRIFVLDPIPAWIPVFNPLKRLTRTPKHHLVDPALAARLVKVGRDGLLQGKGVRVAAPTGTWLGALFESLVTQSVRVYADASDARVGHLRTKDTTREIDLIVEGADHRVVAIEVKLGATVSDHDVRHLNWLHQRLGSRLADRIVVTTGEFAYRRPDGVAIVPLALLGP